MSIKIEVSRELLERLTAICRDGYPALEELRALLAAPVVKRQPVAWQDPTKEWSSITAKTKREWLKLGSRGHTEAANMYTIPLYASQPAPVSVRQIHMADVVRAHMEIPGCPVMTSNQCHALAGKLNACLDKVKELNQ